MHHVIRSAELPPSSTRTVEFQGEPYGAGISFILVDNEPGQGPKRHTHPYPETWVVREGRVLMTAAEEEFEAGPGDVIVVGPGTPHGFSNPGPGRLQMVCIHASDHFVTEWLTLPTEKGADT